MKTLRSLFASLLTLVAVACGETPTDPDQATPLAILKGTISNPNRVEVTGSMRTAIVWFTFENDKFTTFAVAQGVEVQPTLPAGFELTLADPPPPEAITLLDYRNDKESQPVRGAFGLVIAYEDVNENGRLDIARQGDATYLARVVGGVGGEKPSALVTWFEPTDVTQALGFADTDDGSKPKAGFNLLVRENGQERWVDLGTPLPLTLLDSPAMQLFQCANGLDKSRDEGEEPPPNEIDQIPEGPGPNGQWPLKGDPRLTCNSSGLLGYTECVSTSEVCLLQRSCTSSYWRKPEGSAATGWPCD